ncbi:MAG TPA: ABC transporter permease, partial [Pyrinomonadaceae bacterium]|nr:ABC transporter permease [Pyrinomonadaceae bacterium]
METLIQDLRYGVRMLIKGRTFTLMTILILALGIGATSAIFSVVNVILLKPLPYKDAERIVMLWENNPRLQLGIDNLPASAGNFVDWQSRTRSFEHIAALMPDAFNLTGVGDPERLAGARVSANLFQLMGVEAKPGNTFSLDADKPENSNVVILSHSLWQRRFGSDPNIVGRALTLDAKSYTVVGVMPEGFRYPSASDLPPSFDPPQHCELWVPLALTATQISKR